MAGDPKQEVFVERCNENIIKTLDLTRDMIALAEKGSAEPDTPDCLILYATLLDTAYRIKKLAEKERETHISKNKWK
ncbi:MAG: hypothetical protein CSA22_05660 [Deltaproteobacteria bacterium]|nr:MAG: hypothetical protein CSA22_05660 [Deltaproteobacteria bacterium]